MLFKYFFEILGRFIGQWLPLLLAAVGRSGRPHVEAAVTAAGLWTNSASVKDLIKIWHKLLIVDFSLQEAGIGSYSHVY